jgi:hypothetical protein
MSDETPDFGGSPLIEDNTFLTPNPVPAPSNQLHSKSSMPIRVANFV